MSQGAIIAGVVCGTAVSLTVAIVLWVRIRQRRKHQEGRSSWIGTRLGTRVGSPKLLRGWIIDQFNDGRSNRSQESMARNNEGYQMPERVLSIAPDESTPAHSPVLPPLPSPSTPHTPPTPSSLLSPSLSPSPRSPPAQYAERRQSAVSVGSDTPTPSSSGSDTMLMSQSQRTSQIPRMSQTQRMTQSQRLSLGQRTSQISQSQRASQNLQISPTRRMSRNQPLSPNKRISESQPTSPNKRMSQNSPSSPFKRFSQRPRPPRPLPPVPGPRPISTLSPTSTFSRLSLDDNDSDFSGSFFKGEEVRVQETDVTDDDGISKALRDLDAGTDYRQVRSETWSGADGDCINGEDVQDGVDTTSISVGDTDRTEGSPRVDAGSGRAHGAEDGLARQRESAVVNGDPDDDTNTLKSPEEYRNGEDEEIDSQDDDLFSEISEESDAFPSSLELDNLEAGRSQTDHRRPAHKEAYSVRPLPVIPVIAIPRNSIMGRDDVRDRTLSTPASFAIPIETPVDDWTPSRRSVFFHAPYYDSGAASPSKRSSKASSIKSLSKVTARMSSASVSLIAFPRRWSRVDRIDPGMRSSTLPVTPRSPEHPPLPFPLDSRISTVKTMLPDPVGRTASPVAT
ncbi:hypothetical protein CERSUDRAFT_116449 [Gelatoporia subvermispora B]|uniref:Uncharacterized protein n=1 Tax=Ceriporiopsis subvermispora (strain B) TaxID=914234 RepID=M2PG29_CERS8|nr:hypothetical protein CERSUDRAFT_116449 [Gelatoporia subvermispora B]